MRTEYDAKGQPLAENYEDHLIESLKDPTYAKEYINAALEDEDHRVFLLALRDVAIAFGISSLATAAGLNRENIYTMLSTKGNPRISSLMPILRAIGIRLTTEKIKETSVLEERYEPVGYAISTEAHYTPVCPNAASFHDNVLAWSTPSWLSREPVKHEEDRRIYLRTDDEFDGDRCDVIFENKTFQDNSILPMAAANQELALAA